MEINKEKEFKPKKEKVEISNQKPSKTEVIRAVFRLVNNRTNNKRIRLRLMAEKNGGKAEIKEE